MANIVTLRSGNENLLVANSGSSPFVQFIAKYLAKNQFVTIFTVNAVMNNFDALGREGVTVFRGALLEWLWQNRGYKVNCTIAA